MDISGQNLNYTQGYWIWDNDENSLNFINTTPTVKVVAKDPHSLKIANKIHFIDSFDNLLQAHFRKLFQRKIKLNEPNIVTLQDIKDVAIFTAHPQDLSLELIDFLHTKRIDSFLRSLIFYFQYYLQIWEYLQQRRNDPKLPNTTTLNYEDTIRDNLSTLRVIVAKYYSTILLGYDDVHRFHHINPRTHVSLSERDRRLSENLLYMLGRIIWIALNRKYLPLIKIELTRILRTNLFNPKSRKSTNFRTTPNENRVVYGLANFTENKLNHRSPLIQEVLYGKHERIEFLETVSMAPEEVLFERQIGIGILGHDRQYYEPFLRLKEEFVNKIHFQPFNLLDQYKIDLELDRVNENADTITARIQQCKMWRRYLYTTIFK